VRGADDRPPIGSHRAGQGYRPVGRCTDASDDRLAETVCRAGHLVYRGDLDDVLGRFIGVLGAHPADQVVRLTGDCPLIDPDVIDQVIAHHLAGGFDYTSNVAPPTFPDGLDVEVMRAPVLIEGARTAELPVEREHVTQFIHRNLARFKIGNVTSATDLSALRWTVDRFEDLVFARAVYASLLPERPDFRMGDVLNLIARVPGLAAVNRGLQRNEALV
jgi:spore coat polysaccharide biosynthesis protein SpsF